MPTSNRKISGRVSRAAYLLLAFAALATVAAAVMLPGDRPAARESALLLSTTRGSDLGLRTSATGEPILTAPGLVPGASATGQIKVRNTGSHPLTLNLVRRRLVDRPGLYGGRLSDAIQVQIVQVRHKRKGNKPKPAYAGRVVDMRRIRLKRLRPNTTRTYHFAVRMLDGGLPASPTGGDNAYQGAQASVDFVWSGVVR